LFEGRSILEVTATLVVLKWLCLNDCNLDSNAFHLFAGVAERPTELNCCALPAMGRASIRRRPVRFVDFATTSEAISNDAKVDAIHFSASRARSTMRIDDVSKIVTSSNIFFKD
jgi:hypothetical protein